MQYQTAIPLRMFFGIFSIGIFIVAAVILGGLLLVYGLGWSFGARAFGADRLPTWLGMPADYYRDAFWIALGGTAVLVGVKRFLGALDAWWPALHRGLPAAFGGDFDAIYPAASVIGGAIWHSLFLTGTFALAASFLGAELRVRWLRLVLFFAVAAALVSDWGNAADFLQQFLASLLILGIVVFGIRRVARFNLLGIFLVVASTASPAGAVEMFSQADGFYRSQGYFIVAALVLLLGWPLVAWWYGPGATILPPEEASGRSYERAPPGIQWE